MRNKFYKFMCVAATTLVVGATFNTVVASATELEYGTIGIHDPIITIPEYDFTVPSTTIPEYEVTIPEITIPEYDFTLPSTTIPEYEYTTIPSTTKPQYDIIRPTSSGGDKKTHVEEIILSEGDRVDYKYNNYYIDVLYIDGDVLSAENAFVNSTIEHLIMADNVTIIPEYMFSGATINTISFSDNLTSIENNAFAKATFLSDSINIPDTIRTIGEYAFYGLDATESKIDTLELKNVSIGYGAFENTTIDNLILSGDNVTVSTIKENGNKVSNEIFSDATINKLTVNNGVTNIPDNLFYVEGEQFEIGQYSLADSVKTIGSNSFKNVIFTSRFTLPEGVTSIGDGAFCGATFTYGFSIPSSVKNIGAEAFKDISDSINTLRLSDVTIGTDAFANTYIYKVILEGSNVIADKSFSGAEINEFEVLNGISAIPDNIFYTLDESARISRCVIPSSVTNIGNSSFRNTIISNITIPETVKEIGAYAFSGATLPTRFVIPDTVEKISEGAFSYLESTLEDVVLSSVTIGKEAFAHTEIDYLRLDDDNVIINNSFQRTVIHDFGASQNVTIIPDNMFFATYSSNSDYKNIISHFSYYQIKRIGEYAFANTEIHNTVNLDDIESIGKYAFYNSGSLDGKLDLRNVSVGENAFMDTTLRRQCKVDAELINSGALSGAIIQDLYIEYAYLDKITNNVFNANPSGKISKITFSGIEIEWAPFINGFESEPQIAEATVTFVGTDSLEPDNILVLESDGKYHYHIDGVTDTTKNGLIFHDNVWIYLEEGIWIHDKYEFVDYDGGTFLIANGALAQLSGLVQYGDDFYFLSDGQLQKDYTGLAMYDGEWFYVINGVLAKEFKGILDYDGSKFLVADGRLLNSYSGLFLNTDGLWYFIASGQVQTQYVGLALYDGAWFYVLNGMLAVDYFGPVEYDGAVFNVVAGKVVF